MFLGLSENQIWHKTHKQIMTLFLDYKDFKGLKEKEITIDDVIPF